MKVLVINPHRGAVAYHRLIVPHFKLKEQNPNITIYNAPNADAILQDRFKDVNVIVFSRLIPFDWFEIKGKRVDMETVFYTLKRLGKKIVLDMDDWWMLDDHHILKNKLDPNFVEQTIRSIKVASIVTTTHKRLLKKIKPYNKNVYILPNAINLDEEQWKQKKWKKKKRVTFGYIGGDTHEQDLRSMQCDFKNVVSFSCIQQYDWCFKDTLKPKDEFSYGTLYDELDVSLAPLEQTPFNVCKSNLKVLEASAKGVCCAVSNVPPYTDWLPESLIKFDKGESWESLKDITYDESQKRGKQLREELINRYDINLITKERFKIYLA